MNLLHAFVVFYKERQQKVNKQGKKSEMLDQLWL